MTDEERNLHGAAHLSDEAVDALLGEVPGEQNGGRNLPVWQHLAGCVTCRELFEAQKEAQNVLRGLRAGMKIECPRMTENWAGLVAGLLPLSVSRELREHAARCDACAEVLKRELAAFRDEPTSEEIRFLEDLPSARSADRRELAYRLAAASASGLARVPVRSPTRFWKVAGGAIAALAASLTAFVWLNPARRADSHLAEAYRENRVLEMRFEGAPAAPLARTTRSGSAADESPSLDEGRAVISRQLKQHPDDPEWMQRQGRAFLLASKPDRAIAVLLKAGRLEPGNTSLDIDLASAYYERCIMSNQKKDCEAALSRLNQVVARDPGNATARFNRAVALESLDLFSAAEQEWKTYLKIDPNGPWAAEAKKRLAAIGGRKRRLNSVNREDLANRDVAAATDSVFVHWPQRDRSASAAMKLASVLETAHHDRWLRDILTTSRNASMEPGLVALGKTIEADAIGDFREGERTLETALRVFTAAHNTPGLMRAQAEQLYLWHHAVRDLECAQTGGNLAPVLERRGYVWLSSFVREEIASCQAAMERFDEARANALAASKLAEFGNYPELSLRAQGILASVEHAAGNSEQLWNLNVAGLDRWWAGWHRPMRAYQFYMDLSLAAREEGEPAIALAMAREAELRAAATSHRLAQQFAVIERASAALDAGEWREARAAFARAEKLSQGEQADNSYRAEVQIGIARLNLLDRRAQIARTRLSQVAAFVHRAENVPLAINWMQASAEAARIDHRASERESALRTLISFANAGLLSLASEADRVRWMGTLEAAHRDLAASLWERGEKNGALAVLEQMRGNSRAEHSPAASIAWEPWHGERQLGQQLLCDRAETVLSYSTLGRSLRIWVYGASGIHVATAPAQPAEIQLLAARLTEHASDASISNEVLRSESQALYSDLIAPVENWLPAAGPITIEAEGALWSLPWEVLQDSRHALLSQRFQIVLSPGFNYRNHVSEHLAGVGPASRATLLMPPMEPGERPLSDLRLEEASFRKHFVHSTVFSGGGAPWMDLPRILRETELIHYAGHSAVRHGQTILELPTGNGKTNPLTVTRDALPRCRLVVLSACSTAGNSAEQVVGAESLVRPFIACGIPYVLATRWPVDSTVAARTVDSFYGLLLSGMSPSVALGKTMEKLRADTSTAHPFYWAAFVLFGSGT